MEEATAENPFFQCTLLTGSDGGGSTSSELDVEVRFTRAAGHSGGQLRVLDCSTSRCIHSMMLSEVSALDFSRAEGCIGIVPVKGETMDFRFRTSDDRNNFCSAVRRLRSSRRHDSSPLCRTDNATITDALPDLAANAVASTSFDANKHVAIDLSKLGEKQRTRLAAALRLVTFVHNEGRTKVDMASLGTKVDMGTLGTKVSPLESKIHGQGALPDARPAGLTHYRSTFPGHQDDGRSTESRETGGDDWLKPFYVMEMNRYGFYEPRMMSISATRGTFRLSPTIGVGVSCSENDKSNEQHVRTDINIAHISEIMMHSKDPFAMTISLVVPKERTCIGAENPETLAEAANIDSDGKSILEVFQTVDHSVVLHFEQSE